jgi:P4 family phage/plasmid primase-like protien
MSKAAATDHLKMVRFDEPEADTEEQLTAPAYKPDDDMIAGELAVRLNGRARLFHGRWYVWERGYWAERDTSEMRLFVRNNLRDWRERGVNVTQQRIRSITSMLEDDLFTNDRLIMRAAAEQRRYINLRNGLFNLETMELEPHRPELYFTSQLDFDYNPEALDCPTWFKYLNTSLVHPDGTTDNSLVTLVQEALGYSLTARTDLKSSFWLVGERDSGKSTLIAFLKLLMGSLHSTIDLNQLGTNRFLLGGIIGKRVITFTEAETNTVLPDALYKALVGGADEMYADVKNRDPIVFKPECKVWWAMNGMPRISDRSGATTRRIFIIPFNRSIPQERRIADLEQRLRSERTAIFNWLLIHYQRVMRAGGFSPCPQSENRRNEYISENDTEHTYLEMRCERHESFTVNATDLYLDYKSFCESFGFKPRNMNQIASEWRRLGLSAYRSNGRVNYRGVRIKTS